MLFCIFYANAILYFYANAILYFLCKCYFVFLCKCTYDFNFGVTPSHQQRVVGENSLLFCSAAANWIFAQLQIASLMKACHCQAGLEWVNVINFLFCDLPARKMWNSLCFGKSYLGLMQQGADMERRFCIRLNAKLALIKLTRDADALVMVILPAHKDENVLYNTKYCLWVKIRFILVGCEFWQIRASRLKTKLKSGLCHPHPQLASRGPTLGKAWWVMFWTFSHHLHHRWHHCHHRHHHICHHGHRGVCFTDCCAETNSSRLNISTLPDSTLEPIYEIGKPWFGILRLA